MQHQGQSDEEVAGLHIFKPNKRNSWHFLRLTRRPRRLLHAQASCFPSRLPWSRARRQCKQRLHLRLSTTTRRTAPSSSWGGLQQVSYSEPLQWIVAFLL